MFNTDKKVYNEKGKFIKFSKLKTNKNNMIIESFKEHCEFKDAPCNYNGHGWYDRCAWCKDNNGFKRKNEDKTKPF